MSEFEDNYEEETAKGSIVPFLFILFIISSLVAFFISFYFQEVEITEKLNECSFYTVATPTEMTTSHSMYFKFYYNNKTYDDYTTVGAEDLGLSYTKRSAMSTRYWVRVYCKDLNIIRMYWDTKVPDTLQYIPKEGWKEIPYGLAEEE